MRALLLFSTLIILTLTACSEPVKETGLTDSYNAIAAAALKDKWEDVYDGYSIALREKVDKDMAILLEIQSLTNATEQYDGLSPKDSYLSYMLSSPHKELITRQFGTIETVDTTGVEAILTVNRKENKKKITNRLSMVKEGTSWKYNGKAQQSK